MEGIPLDRETCSLETLTCFVATVVVLKFGTVYIWSSSSDTLLLGRGFVHSLMLGSRMAWSKERRAFLEEDSSLTCRACGRTTGALTQQIKRNFIGLDLTSLVYVYKHSIA